MTSLQTSLRTRAKIAWHCVGLIVLLASTATAQNDPFAPSPPQNSPVRKALPNQQAQDQPPVRSVPPTGPLSRTNPPSTGYADPATATQQVQLEVIFAIVADEALIKWAMPNKAIIKRVAGNESRPATLKKATPAASRTFSLMFGSESPVPLLFNAKLRESLLTNLKKDKRSNLMINPTVVTLWNRQVIIKSNGSKDDPSASPLVIKLKPTPIGNGELGLEVDALIASTPYTPAGKVAHWNLRARPDHTLMLPIAPINLESQLVALVLPKIVHPVEATQIASPFSSPPTAYQPSSPKNYQAIRQSHLFKPPVAQTGPTPVYPGPPKAIDPRNASQAPIHQPTPVVRKAVPATSSNMRLVTLTAMLGSDVSPGDVVDVLLFLTEYGTPKKTKVETLFESLSVFEPAKAVDGECTQIKLLVDKKIVGDLLLAGDKGMLRLIVHRSSIPTNGLPLAPSYVRPINPSSDRIVYRRNGTWGPPNQTIQAGGTQALPRSSSVTRKPKSEVQQVLEEVREMRKMIQGLRDDMNQLRESARTSSTIKAGKSVDILLPKGTSRTIVRDKRIQRVDGFDTEVVGVHAVTSKSIRVFGHRPGLTTVKCYFEGDSKVPEEVVVQVVAPPLPYSRLKTPQPKKSASSEAAYRPSRAGLPVPQRPVALPRGPRTEIQIRENHLDIIKRDKEIVRMAVGAASIANIAQYAKDEIGITAVKPGSTTILLWLKGEADPERIIVEVLPAASSPDKRPSSTGTTAEDAAHQKIEQALKKEISIDIADSTLQETLTQLQETSGVNITIDMRAVEAEGISTDAKVSIHLTSVTLRSALKILLSPLELGTVIEDEVLKVTSKRAVNGKQFIVAYQVKDLIQGSEKGKTDFDALSQLIMTVVEPDTWQEVGGVGSIAASPQTGSLVVRQTQGVHEEIQQLFSALRKWKPSHADKPAEASFDLDSVKSTGRISPLKANPRPAVRPQPTRKSQLATPVKKAQK
jgi:hypothetical protein